MSYCRWSSHDFQCDVYVFADAQGGWTTHVRSRRVVLTPERRASLPSQVSLEDPGWSDAILARHTALYRLLESAPREQLTAPSAGESFHDATAGGCAERLERLRAEGLWVPQDAIDALRAEDAPGL